MRKVREYLDTGEALRRLNHEARRLAELDRAYRHAVPDTLAEASGVHHINGATLFLWADGGAVAAKLRQLSPMVLVKLKKLMPQCTAIRVTVRVGGHPTGRTPSPRPRIGTGGAEALRGLARALPPSALGRALARLAAHGAGGSEDGQ